MNKSILFSVMLTFALLAGCSKDTNEKDTPTPTATTTTTPAEQVKETKEPTKEPTPTASPEAKKDKKRTADEQLSLDYINVYLNGTDVEAKKKFVEDNVRDDMKPLFTLGANSVTEENEMYKNPVVEGSADYDTSGVKGTAVLIKNDSEKELIALVFEGKLGIVFNSEDTDVSVKKSFDDMRSKIK